MEKEEKCWEETIVVIFLPFSKGVLLVMEWKEGRDYHYVRRKYMKTPDIIKEAARKLRKNMTEAELILWSIIKGDKLGVKFLRQKPLFVYREYNGLDRYIISDFYCFEKKLIIEVDGSVHNVEEVYILDKYKEKLLLDMGVKILRIQNDEIKKNLGEVLVKIKNHL